MTPTATAQRAPTPPARPAARRRGLLALLAVLVLLVVGITGWRLLAADWRGGVTVASGTGGDAGTAVATVSCQDAEVRERRFGGVRAPVMPARPGMDCRMPVTVTNTAAGAVVLEAIVLRHMGLESRGEIQVTELDGLERAPQHSEEGMHAAFAVHRVLKPGDSYRVDVRFTHRDAGCSDATTWIGEFPTVVVSALGVPGEVASGETIAFRGTGAAGGCGR